MNRKGNPLDEALQSGLLALALKRQAAQAADAQHGLLVRAVHEALVPYLPELLCLPSHELERDSVTHQRVAEHFLLVMDLQNGGSKQSTEEVWNGVLHAKGITVCGGFDDAKRHHLVVPHPANGLTHLTVRSGSAYGSPRSGDRAYLAGEGVALAVAELIARVCKDVNYVELARLRGESA